jgi:hypothetical protein
MGRLYPKIRANRLCFSQEWSRSLPELYDLRLNPSRVSNSYTKQDGHHDDSRRLSLHKLGKIDVECSIGTTAHIRKVIPLLCCEVSKGAHFRSWTANVQGVEDRTRVAPRFWAGWLEGSRNIGTANRIIFMGMGMPCESLFSPGACWAVAGAAALTGSHKEHWAQPKQDVHVSILE